MPRVPPPGRIPLLAGLRDFPTLFDVSPRTPDTWINRGQLPPEDGVISGKSRIWLVSRLEVWAKNNDMPIYPDRLRESRKRGEHTPRRGRKGHVVTQEEIRAKRLAAARKAQETRKRNGTAA